MAMCQACENEHHYLCGMQTWCECPCDGSADYDQMEWDGYYVDDVEDDE